MEYMCPNYEIDLTPEMMLECCCTAVGLLAEAGESIRERTVGLERIRNAEPHCLPSDKQVDLDKTYARAEKDLLS